MSYRHVSRFIIWTYDSFSNVLGMGEEAVGIEEVVAFELIGEVRDLVLLEHVFIAGGVMTISTIGSNPRG